MFNTIRIINDRLFRDDIEFWAVRFPYREEKKDLDDFNKQLQYTFAILCLKHRYIHQV